MYPIIHIFGKEVSSYGLMAVIGIFAVIIYTIIRAVKSKHDIPNRIGYVIFAFIMSFIGSALVYQISVIDQNLPLLKYLFSDFDYFASHFQSGFVFYGGLLGIPVGCLIFTKIIDMDTREFFRQTIPSIPLFHIFGRIGCFLAGCCYGCESEHFGVVFSNAITDVDDLPRLPIQLIEATGNFIIFLVLCFHQKKKDKFYQSAGIYYVSYGVMRFILEFFRGDLIRGIFGPFSTSQWFSLLIFIPLGIYCLVRNEDKNFFNSWLTPRKRKKKKAESV